MPTTQTCRVHSLRAGDAHTENNNELMGKGELHSNCIIFLRNVHPGKGSSDLNTTASMELKFPALFKNVNGGVTN